jgi:hypothetical protein
MRAVIALLVISISLAISACNSDFTMPFEVEKPRLLAVRFEPKADPSRAWPRVGEQVDLRWLVARPTPSRRPLEKQYSGAIAVCAGTVLPTGNLYCALEVDLDAIMAKGENEISNIDELVMPLTVAIDPRAIAMSETVLFFGALCVDGTVERIPGTKAGETPANELYRCIDNDDADFKEPLSFTSTMIVDYEDDAVETNDNPSFACDPSDAAGLCARGRKQDDELRVGGAFVLVRPNEGARDDEEKQAQPWEQAKPDPGELPFEDCRDDPDLEALQVLAGSGEHTIRIRFDPSDRELFTGEVMELNRIVIKTRRKELLVSHAATQGGGKLDRYFSIVERDTRDSEAEVELTYTPPEAGSADAKAIPSSGKLVRFYFVVRDQRGGVDVATRELCLLPAAKGK